MNTGSTAPSIVILHSGADNDVSEQIRGLLDYKWQVWSFSDVSSDQWTSEAEQNISKAILTIFIWSSDSLRNDSEVRNELIYAKHKDKKRLHVCVDDAELPIHASGEFSVFYHRGDHEFKFAESLLKNVMKLTTNSFTRPDKITFPRSGKSLDIPCFARSVSSFETLRKPGDMLIALSLHPSTTPILMSAYDLSRLDTKEQHQINIYLKALSDEKAINPGFALFLDSGNYEASRRQKLPKQGVKESEAWTIDEFKETVHRWDQFDVIFSFDDPHHSGTREEMAHRVIELFEETCHVAKETQDIVPVIHAMADSDGSVDLDKLEFVIDKVVRDLEPRMIAIPERELGNGIVERMRSAARIRSFVEKLDSDVFLHLLGTGNPISIAALSAVGADSFDGLEWCRVAAEPGTGRLFHAQHGDFFLEEVLRLSNDPTVARMADDGDFLMKLLVQNIEVFDEWIKRMQYNVNQCGLVGALNNISDEGIRQHLKKAI